MRPLMSATKSNAPLTTLPQWRWGVLAGVLTLPLFISAVATWLWQRGWLLQHRLPSYTLTVGCSHCGSGTPLQLSPESLISISLRPLTQVRTAVQVHSFVQTEHGRTDWPVPFVIAPTGTAQLNSPVASLPPLPTGNSRLVFLVGDAGKGTDPMPSSRPAPPNVQVLSQAIRFNTHSTS